MFTSQRTQLISEDNMKTCRVHIYIYINNIYIYIHMYTYIYIYIILYILYILYMCVCVSPHVCLSQIYVHLHLSCQGMSLIDKDILNKWPQQEWIPECRPKLETWLEHETTEESKARLRCIGNIAMPAMTFLALQMLGHGERDDH